MGLVNRLVAPGEARAAAEELAAEIADLPQACLRNDRRSALDQHGLSDDQAMAAELRLGLESLTANAAAGAARFAAGEGRHGAPAGGV
jgi:enoyl-CoA hydratase